MTVTWPCHMTTLTLYFSQSAPPRWQIGTGGVSSKEGPPNGVPTWQSDSEQTCTFDKSLQKPVHWEAWPCPSVHPNLPVTY